MKTPKTSTKLKINAPKSPAVTDSAKKSKEPKTPKSKASTSRKAAAKDTPAEDEDEDAESPKEPEKPFDPAEAKQKKEKEGEIIVCPSQEIRKLTPDSAVPPSQIAKRLPLPRSGA